MLNPTKKKFVFPNAGKPQPKESKGDDSQKMAEKSSKAVVGATRRKYAFKKVKLDAGTEPLLTKRSLLIGMVALLIAVVGVLVVPQLMSSGVARYYPRPERQIPIVKKELNALAIALGRYRLHVGAYPTNEEGLEVLAYRQPEDLHKIRRAHPGWDGPYVNHIMKDLWGKRYVYEMRPDGGHPILYSCGPDRKARTSDDILPNQAAFDQPFRDTSWTNNWLPVELRVVVKNSAFIIPKESLNTGESSKAK